MPSNNPRIAAVLPLEMEYSSRLLAGAPTWLYVVGMFLSNLLVGWVTVEILRAYARGQRQAKEAVQPVAQTAHH